MLVVRPDQMEVFKKAALRSFESQMVAHLAEFSPPLFKAVGKEQMRQAVHFGIDRAGGYGFTCRGPIRLYLELMLLFGSYFDTDPQYPWVPESLTHRNTGSQMQRAIWLYEKALEYHRRVAGIGDAYALEAFRRILMVARPPMPTSSENFVAEMLRELTFIYPEKVAFVGEEGIKALIQEGVGEARKQRSSSVREIALLIVLMLVFGHGCAADPLYPWIARSLQGDAIAGPEGRAKHLEKEMLTWLENILCDLEADEG